MRGQPTDMPHVFKENVHKCLLTSYSRLNPLTLLNPTIAKYNTLLHLVLEDPYEYDTRSTCYKGLLVSKIHMSGA